MFSFNFVRWLKSQFRSRIRTIQRQPRTRLLLEQLEDRITPTTYDWTGAGGAGNPNWSFKANWGGTAIDPTQPIDLVFNTPTAYASNNDLAGLDINSITFAVNNITLTGNAFTLGNPVNIGSGFLDVQAGFNNEVISAGMDIQLAGANSAQQFITVDSASTLTINSQLSGTTGAQLTKEGVGILVLTGNNSGYVGPFAIDHDAGIVEITNSQALGQALNGGTTSTIESLTLTNPSLGPLPPATTFNLSFGVSTTAAIPYTGVTATDAAAVQAALNLLPSINAGGNSVAVYATSTGTSETFLITYTGPTWSGANVAQQVTGTALGSGSFNAPVSLSTGGLTSPYVVTVGNNSQLQLSNVIGGSVADTVELFGNGAVNNGALYNLAGNNTWSGNVILESSIGNNSDIGLAAGSLTISGVISDSGGAISVTKLGAGKLILANANTYRGSTYVEDGVLLIENPLALGAIPSAGTYVEHNNISGDQGSLELAYTGGAALPAANLQDYILQNPSSPYNAATNPYVGFTVPNYQLYLMGPGYQAPINFTLENVEGNNAWSGPITLETDGFLVNSINIGVDVFPVLLGAPTTLTLSGVISDLNAATSPVLNKWNLGNLILEPSIVNPVTGLSTSQGTANLYKGTTTIWQGTITLEDSQGLGLTTKPSATGLTSVDIGASLDLVANVGHIDSVTGTTNRLTVSAPLQIDGAGVNNLGALRSVSGINTYTVTAPNTNPIIQIGLIGTGNASIGVDPEPVETANSSYAANDYSLTINGGLNGITFGGVTANINKVGAGQLILPNANASYLGTFDIQSGWVTIKDPEGLGKTLPVIQELEPTDTVASGAALMFAPFAAGTSFTFTHNLIVQGMGITHPYALINQKGAIENLGGLNSIAGNIQLIGQTGIGVEQTDPNVPSELFLNGEQSETAPAASFTLPTVYASGGVTQYSQIIDTGSVNGTISIAYNGANNDNLRVYYGPRGTPGSTLIANTTVSGAGVFPITGLAYSGGGTNLEIVVDNGVVPAGSANWNYAVTVTPNLLAANVHGGIVKVGSQRLDLQGAGIYTGGVDVQQGVVRIVNDSALGASTNNLGTTVETGAALELTTLLTSNTGGVSAGANIQGVPLTLYGTGNSTFGDAPLTVLAKDNQWTGPISLQSNVAISFQGTLASQPVNAITANYRDINGNLTLTGVSPTVDITTTTPGVAAAGGAIPVSDVQMLTFGGAIANSPSPAPPGYFTLTYNGTTSGNILWSADPNVLIGNIRAALAPLLGAGNFSLALTSPTINVHPNARLVVTGVVSDGAGQAVANPLIHNYVLSGPNASFSDTLGGSALVPVFGFPSAVPGTLTAAGYAMGNWPANQGLTLSNWVGAAPSAAGNYSIQIDFDFTQIPAPTGFYDQILNFMTGNDNGILLSGTTVANTALDAYNGGPNTGPGGFFAPNVPFDLIIMRDGTTGQVTGYVNGVQALSFNDSVSAQMIFSSPNNIATFFEDIDAVPNENSGGNVTAIKIYNRPLTPAEALTVSGGGALGGNSGTALAPSDLNAAGGGELLLAGANTYRGATNVQQGTLTIANNKALGAPGSAGAQELSLTNPVPGSTNFNLAFNGVQTATPLTFTGGSADAAAIQSALQGLSSIGAGNVLVTQGDPGSFLITFYGPLAGTSQLVSAALAGSGEVAGTAITAGIEGGTVVVNNAQLQMEGGITVGGEPLLLQGAGNNLESTVQTFTIGSISNPPNPPSGTYSLNFNGGSTVAIPDNANALQVQTALQNLINTTNPGGQVQVHQSSSSAGSDEFQQLSFPAGYSGSYQLYFDPHGGAPALNYNLTPALPFTGLPFTDKVNILTALQALQTVGGVAVGGAVGAGGAGPGPPELEGVTFLGGLGNQPLPLIQISYPGAHTGVVTVAHIPLGTTATHAFSVVFTGAFTGQLAPLLSVTAATQYVPTLGASGSGTIANGTTYNYVVTALTPGVGETIVSNEQTITTTASNQAVNLSWSQVPNATGYNIYRSTLSGIYSSSFLATIPSGSTTTYTDTGAAVGPGTPSDITVSNPAYSIKGGTANATPFQYFTVGPNTITNAQVFNAGGFPAQDTAGPVTGVDTYNGTANDIIISTAGGGEWKTIDGGQHWTQLFDAVNNAPMFGGAVAIAQPNPTRSYYGTGEGNNSGDSYYGSGVYANGVLLTDSGVNPLAGKAINKIIVNPANTFEIWVAVSDQAVNGTLGNAGIWRYDGTHWLNMTAANGFASTNADYSDLAYDAATGTLYGALAGTDVLKCANPAIAGTPTVTAGGLAFWAALGDNIKLASNGAANTIYAAITSSFSNGLLDIFKTVNGGVTWGGVGGPEYLSPQGTYASAIAASGNDVFVAGSYQGVFPNFVLWSHNGGGWKDISQDAGLLGPHTAVHALSIDANGNLIAGTDGGVWRATLNYAGFGSLTSWSDLNGDLGNTELNSVSPQPNSANLLGATQDNGIVLSNGTLSWSQVAGGAVDGSVVRYVPTNPNIAYAVINGAVYQSINGGALFGGAPIQNGNTVAVDTNNPARVVVGGATLWESLNTGAAFSWVNLNDPAKSDLVALADKQGPYQADPAFTTLAAHAANFDDSGTVYTASKTAVGVGLGPDLRVTKDDGQHWSVVNRAPTALMAAGTSISSITVDPADRDIIYVTATGFSNSAPGSPSQHVFKSTNAGQTWTDISAGLPDLPTWSFVVDPRTNDLYAGTDVGVYKLAGGAGSWVKFGAGLPDVQVTDLQLNTTTNVLTIASFGRGAWQFYLSDTQAGAGALRALGGNDTWTGSITLTGPTTFGANGSQALQTGISGAQLILSGVISDATPLETSTAANPVTKTGGGDVALRGANTFGGLTDVQQGNLIVQNPNALGAAGPGQGTVVEAGAALELASNLSLEPVTLNGNGVQPPYNGHYTGALDNISNFNTYTGTITLNTNSTIGVQTGSLTLSPANAADGIVDGGTLTTQYSLDKEGTGELILAGPDTYQGGTTVTAGILDVQNSLALGAASATVVSDGAQLRLEQSAANQPVLAPLTLAAGGVIPAGTTYYYIITALTPSGESIVSVEQKITTTAANQAVNLSWAAVAGATGYNIYRSTTSTVYTNALLTTIGSGATTTYTDLGAVVSAGTPASVDVTNQTLYLSGSGIVNDGALRNVAGNNIWGGKIVLSTVPDYSPASNSLGVVAVYVDANNSLTLSGPISEGAPPQPSGLPAANASPSGLADLGAGTLVLGGNNTYTGGTYAGYTFGVANTSGAAPAAVPGGVIDLQSSNALGLNQGNEIQRISTYDPPGANDAFQLTFNGQTTGALTYGLPASGGVGPTASVQNALNALPSIGGNGVTVTGSTVYTGLNEVQSLTLTNPESPFDQPTLSATAAAGGNLAPTTYYYVVTAIGPFGGTIGETIPSIQQSVTTTAGNATVNLSWSPVAGATGYKVYRSTNTGNFTQSLLTTIPSGATTTYADSGPTATLATPVLNTPAAVLGGSLTAGTTYYYVITATGPTGETAISNQQAITPVGVDLTAGLTWPAVSGATGYRIYRSTTSGNFANGRLFVIASGATTSYNDANLALNASYSPPSQTQFTLTSSVLLKGDTTLGNATVTNLTSTAQLSAGMTVTGNGILAGTKILSIAGPTSITLTATATATAANVLLTFAVTTPALSYTGVGATDAANIQSALQALSTIGANNVAVSPNSTDTAFTITYLGALTDVPQLTLLPTVTQSTASAAATELTPGDGGPAYIYTVTFNGAAFQGAAQPFLTIPAAASAITTAVSEVATGGLGALIYTGSALQLDGDPSHAGQSIGLPLGGNIALNGSGTANSGGALVNASGNNTLQGNLILQSSTTVAAAATTQLTLSGTVQDPALTAANPVPGTPGNLTKAGAGSIILAPVAQTITLNDQPIQNAPSLAAGGSLTAGLTYYYVVTALSATGESFASNQQFAIPAAGNQTVSLTWNPVAGATGYNVYRTTVSGNYATPALLNAVPLAAGTLSYADNGATLPLAGAPPAQTHFTLTYASGAVPGGVTTANITYNGTIGPAGTDANIATALTNLIASTPALAGSTASVLAVNANTFTVTFTGPAAVNLVGLTGTFVDSATGYVTNMGGNTYAGSTLVNAGDLNVQNANSLGYNTSSVQQVAVSGSSGSFQLTFNGKNTVPLQFGATAGQVQTALNNLTTISAGGGAVVVTQAGNNYFVYFDGGPLAHVAQNPLTFVAPLNPGISSITITQLLFGGASTTTVASGASLQLQSAIPLTAFAEASGKQLLLNGTGLNNAGALENVQGSNTWSSSPILLGSTSSLGADGGSSLVISQPITQTSANLGVNKVGAGTIQYTGSSSNTYTGLTNVYAGTLQLNDASPAIAVAGNLQVGDNVLTSQVQTLTLSGFTSGTDQFYLTYNGNPTGNITYYGNASYEAAAIQAALNFAAVIGAGNTATVSPTATPGQFLVAFGGGLAGTNPALLGGGPVLPATGTVTPSLTIMGGPALANAAVVQLEASNQIAATAAATVNNDGLFDLNGHSQTLAALTINTGTTTTGVGSNNTLTVNGPININAGALTVPAASSGTIITDNGNLTMLSGSVTLAGAASALNVTGALAMTSATLTASGAGATLKADGATTLSDSTLTFSGANSSFTAGTSLSLTGSAIHLSGAGSFLKLNSDLTATSDSAAGTSLIDGEGNVLLNGTTRIFTVNAGTQPSDLTISATLQGAAAEGVTKMGTGRLELAAQENYTGATTIDSGDLQADLVYQLDLGALTAGNTFRLTYDNGVQSGSAANIAYTGSTGTDGNLLTALLSLLGTLFPAASFGVNVTPLSTSLFRIAFTGAAASGSEQLSSSTLGVSITTGATIAAANGVVLNGPSAPVVPASLSGTGSVSAVSLASATATGTINPGDNGAASKSGTLSITTAPVTLSKNAIFSVDLNNNHAPGSPVAGQDYDQLAVGSTIDLGNALLTGTPGAGNQLGNQYTIVSAAAVAGHFDGIINGVRAQINDGGALFLNGQKFTVNYFPTSVVLTRSQYTATVTLVSAANPSFYGQDVSFTATVTPEAGASFGSTSPVVTFSVDSNPATSVALNTVTDTAAFSPQSYFHLAWTPGSSHSITAVFSDSLNAFVVTTATPSPVTQGVIQEAVHVGIAANPPASALSPLTYGTQDVTITTTVASALAAPLIYASTPSGYVTFSVDGGPAQPAGGALLTASSQQTYLIPTLNLTAGAHTVLVSYQGDSNYNGNTNSLPLTISKDSSSVSATLSASSLTLGQSVNFTVSVAPGTSGSSGSPTGTLSLFDKANLVSPLASVVYNGGSVNLSTSIVPLGARQLIITYSGDNNYNPTSSAYFPVTVNKAPTAVSFASLPNPTSSTYGQPVTFTANVVPNPTIATTFGAPTGLVTFRADDPVTGLSLGSGAINPVTGLASVLTSGTALASGPHTIYAIYAGDNNFTGAASLAFDFNVLQATPAVTWNTPAPIVYGTPLSAVQLNATVGGSPSGSFTYSQPIGTVLGAGFQPLLVTFNPTDSTDYTPATQSVTLFVQQATPTITWTSPAALSFGTPLSATQLDATASAIVNGVSGPVAGSFAYAPSATVILGAGNNQFLSVNFTPADAIDFTSAGGSTTINIAKAIPLVSAGNDNTPYTGSPQVYPSTDVTVSGAVGLTAASGTLTYTYNGSGAVPTAAGSYAVAITFTPFDTTDYASAVGHATWTIGKATPAVAATPTDGATYTGAPLAYPGSDVAVTGAGGLTNAGGSLTYTYNGTGTVPTAAGTYAVIVTFTPFDTADYAIGTATASWVIGQATPAVTATPADSAAYTGAALAYPNADVSVTGTGGLTKAGGVLTYTYNGSSTTPTAAGAYAVVVTFTPTDTTDYSTATANASWTIGQVTPAVTATPSDSANYTGAPLAYPDADVSVTGPGGLTNTGGVLTYTYNGSSTTPTAAGSYAVAITFTPFDTADYASGTASATWTINKASPVLSASGDSTTYTGAPQAYPSGNVSVTGPSGTLSYTYNGAGAVPTAANTYTVTVTFTPNDAADYKTAAALTTWTIGQAIPTVSANDDSTYFTGAPLAYPDSDVTVSGAGGLTNSGGTLSYTYNGSSTVPTAAGTYAVAITFTPTDSTDYAAAVGNAAWTIINRAASVMKVTPSPLPFIYFTQSPSLTVTLSGGSGTPAGTVTVSEGGTTLAGPLPLSSGSVVIPVPNLAVGTHNLLVTYSGNSTYAPASTSLTQVVKADVTTTAVAASPTASLTAPVFGQPVIFTATVTAAIGGNPTTGTVTFKDGAAILDTESLNGSSNVIASIPLSSLTAAGHSITATYNGNTSDAASTSSPALSYTVHAASTTTALAPASPSPIAFGQSVTFTATVSPVGPSTALPSSGTVTFKDGTKTLATVTLSGSNVATFTTANLSDTTHSITAVYAGANYIGSTSNLVSQSVSKATTHAGLVSSLPSGATFGQTVTFTATVTADTGNAPTSGTVTFKDGSSTLKTVTLNGTNVATFTTTATQLSAINHSITAVYSGTTNVMGSTSPIVTQTVAAVGTTMALTSSSLNWSVHQSIAFTAVVKSVSASAGTPSGGTVTFYIDGIAQATQPALSAGKAKLTFAGFSTLGSHDVYAVYNPPVNGNYATSTSSTLTQQALYASSITLSASASQVNVGKPVTFTAVVAGAVGTPTSGVVYFYDGSRLLGTITLNGSNRATFTTVKLSAATHTITAVYGGDGSTYNPAKTTKAVTVIVKGNRVR